MVVERVFNEDDSILLDSLLTSFIKDQMEIEVEEFLKQVANQDDKEIHKYWLFGMLRHSRTNFRFSIAFSLVTLSLSKKY